MKNIISVILVIFSPSVLSLTFEGQMKNGFFYPSDQVWKVVSIEKNSTSRIPADLGGIPSIIVGQDLFITDRYISLRSPFANKEKVTSACFKKQNKGLVIIAYGSTRNINGYKIQLTNHGDYITMPYGEYFLLKLRKQPLSINFKSIKLKIDSAYNYYLEKFAVENAPCGLTKIMIPKPVHTDLVISNEDGKSFTLKGHSLDTHTFLNFSVISRARKVKVNDNTVIGGCLARKKHYRVNIDSSKRGIFYIIGNITGYDVSTNMSCTKITSIYMLPTSRILDLYPIDYKTMGNITLPPVHTLRFVKWDSDNSVIVSHQNYSTGKLIKFLISGIQTTKLSIKIYGN